MVDVLQTEWQRFNNSVAAELEVLAADARAGRIVAIGVCYVQTGFTWGTYADNVKDVAGTAVMLRGAASTLVHRLHHADMQNMETRVPGTPEEAREDDLPPVALLRPRREEQAELAQVDIDDLHRELERLRGVLRSAEPRAAEAEDRARAAEEAQRAAEQWVENLRDERDALRAEVDRLVGSHFHAKVVSLSLRAEVDRLRGALERADEEMRRHVAERDDLRARIEAMATERARLVIAAYAVVEAAEKDVPSDEEIAAMAKEVSDG